MLKKIKQPVHSYLAWLAISAVYLPSFFIVNIALAQSQMEQASPLIQPLIEQAAPKVEMQPFIIDNQNTNPLMPKNNEGVKPPMQPSQPGQRTEPACLIGMVCSSNRFNQEFNIDDNRFKEMKRGMQGFDSMIKMADSQVVRLQKKKIEIPEELTSAITQAKELSIKIKNAKTPEEVEDLGIEIEDSVSVVQDWMPKLPMLAEFPRIVKQADKEIVKLNKAYTADTKKIKSKKIDLSNELSSFRKEIDNQQDILKEIKALVKTDLEEAISRMQDDFFANLDDVWMNEKIIQIALNYKKSVTMLSTEINQAQKTIIQLKAQKNDTEELEQNLADVMKQFKEMKVVYNTKPLDTDKLFDAISDIMDSVQELRNQIQELTGKTDYRPSYLAPAKDVVVPQGFVFEEKNK